MKKSRFSSGDKLIPVTWAFNSRRNPSGEFNIFKACFFVRGYIQQKTVS